MATALVNVLHTFGLAVPGSIWVFNLAMVGAVVLQRVLVWRWIRPAMDRSRWAVWTAPAIQVTTTAIVAYLTGWGPFMAIGFVLAASCSTITGPDRGDRSWSCYLGGERHCGRCGTCVERAEAFARAGVVEPIEYADASFWRAVASP